MSIKIDLKLFRRADFFSKNTEIIYDILMRRVKNL